LHSGGDYGIPATEETIESRECGATALECADPVSALTYEEPMRTKSGIGDAALQSALRNRTCCPPRYQSVEVFPVKVF